MELYDLIYKILCEYISIRNIEDGRMMSLEEVTLYIERRIKIKFKGQQRELSEYNIERKLICEFTNVCKYLFVYGYCDKKCKKIMNNLKDYMSE